MAYSEPADAPARRGDPWPSPSETATIDEAELRAISRRRHAAVGAVLGDLKVEFDHQYPHQSDNQPPRASAGVDREPLINSWTPASRAVAALS